MASSFSLPDARRIRSYFLRLPLATRVALFLLIAAYIATWIWPGLEQWGALDPQAMDLNNLYRLNTFPFLHKSIFHFLLNTIALIPLLERFEAEHGTVVTTILFTGPFGLIPGAIYTGIELLVLRTGATAVEGASIWVFLLLAHEAIKTYRANPHFALLEWRIPTWTTPLLGILLVSFLVPHTSFLGHMCGAVVGYLWGLGYIRFLAPPDRVLRWIEGKLDLLGRIPHYVSVDQKTYGRYGVLPSTNTGRSGATGVPATLSPSNGTPLLPRSSSSGPGQRLGP